MITIDLDEIEESYTAMETLQKGIATGKSSKTDLFKALVVGVLEIAKQLALANLGMEVEDDE